MSNFEEIISRKNLGSSKWNYMKRLKEDTLEMTVPLSVADMEFRSPDIFYEKMAEYISSKPILGYTVATDKFYDSVIKWQKNLHDWEINKDWIVNTPGVVSAIKIAIDAFSDENDGVINLKPVYYPFTNSINGLNRKEVNVPLINKNNYYTIDFKRLEDEAKKEENKILILCSPHNPIGRVWTRDELKEISRIVIENNLIIVSDEIWADLVNPKYEHTIINKISEEISQRSVICTAPSKTFNLAGFAISNIVIKNEEMREKFRESARKLGLSEVNALGYKACEIVYDYGYEWYKEVLDVIFSNQEYVKNFFEENYPDITAEVSEGTYLQWLDFRALDMDEYELEKFNISSEFFTDEGYIFGEEGIGFERINTAVPRKSLEFTLNKLVENLKELKKLDK